jgi:hypothetical protein
VSDPAIMRPGHQVASSVLDAARVRVADALSRMTGMPVSRVDVVVAAVV